MRIAHLSDLHLLSEAKRSRSWAARFVSIARPLDVLGRRLKAQRALAAASALGATHLVLSGDLTEVGAPTEFEALAEVLSESAFAPEQITLVPGNHDAYTAPEAWQRAFEGPLAPYARQSAVRAESFTPVDLGALVLLPLDTTHYQSVTSSRGVLRLPLVEQLRVHLEAAEPRTPHVIVQHHPPTPRKNAAWQWIDGLQGWAPLMNLLQRHETLSVMHGHLHRVLSEPLVAGGAPRIFGTSATVDDRQTSRLRLYEVVDGAFTAVDLDGHG